MVFCNWLRKGIRCSEADWTLRNLADEIIFIAPVIFWEELTDPILPFNSRIDAIIH